MTRVGWVFLTLVILAGAAFMAMTRFGGPPTVPVLATVENRPGEKVVDHVERIAHAALERLRDPGGAAPVLIVPVRGVGRDAVVDTWGQARAAGREHHGTDIPAPSGTPVLAVADGRVEKLFDSRLGGTTLYQRSADRRWTFYYAHLAGYAAGLHEGQAVRKGEVIAFVGDTGDAGAGNFHLHFGLVRTRPDQRWYEGEDVDAYPSLAGRAPAR